MRFPQSQSTSQANASTASSTARAVLSTKKQSRNSKAVKTFEHHERKQRNRRKNGTVAIKQIKYYQRTTDTLIEKAPFIRIVKEIADGFASEEMTKYKWKQSAIEALQAATEFYATYLFEDAIKATVHAGRVTLRPEDLHIVRNLRGRSNPDEIF